MDAIFMACVDSTEPRGYHKTIAEGTAIAHPLRLREMIHALRETAGESVAGSEEEIISALKRLPPLRLFPEPPSARALAPLAQLLEQKAINARARNVGLLPGTGIRSAAPN